MDKWTSSSRLTSSLFLILQLGPLMIWRSTCFRSLFFSSSLRSLQGYSISARQFEASKFKVSHNALSVVDRSVGGESAPSRLPNSLTKSEKNAISVDKVNAGIRLIQHGSEIMLLWKTSNVALNPGESLFRPASLPVADWITSQFPRCNFSIMFQHLLSSDISGIVVVAKSDYNPDQLPAKSALSCVTFTYEAVIYEEKLPLESTVSTDSLPVEPAEHIKTISDRLEGLKHSISQDLNRGVGLKNTVNQMNFAVVQSARSGSYGTLNLVNITFSGSDYPSLITPSFILDSLSSAGLSCVREGKRDTVDFEIILWKGHNFIIPK